MQHRNTLWQWSLREQTVHSVIRLHLASCLHVIRLCMERRMHEAKQSYREPRVPDGIAYCHLQAQMQAVTIVYLNCFVDESLAYLAGLLHLCPPEQSAPTNAGTPGAGVAESGKMATPRHSLSGSLATASSAQRRSASAAPPQLARKSQDSKKRTLEQLRMAVLLDLEMQAPVIEMPRNSTSADSLELDLGTLHLTNRAALLRGNTHAVDLINIALKKVLSSLCMHARLSGTRGHCWQPLQICRDMSRRCCAAAADVGSSLLQLNANSVRFSCLRRRHVLSQHAWVQLAPLAGQRAHAVRRAGGGQPHQRLAAGPLHHRRAGAGGPRPVAALHRHAH